VFKVLQEHEFYVKLPKCTFARQELSYLGHVISSVGVSTDPKKIQIIADWPMPQNVKELRSFLGMAGYYRKFVKSFGLISKPLTNLLKKGKCISRLLRLRNHFKLSSMHMSPPQYLLCQVLLSPSL
jgi:hypothetical protein